MQEVPLETFNDGDGDLLPIDTVNINSRIPSGRTRNPDGIFGRRGFKIAVLLGAVALIGMIIAVIASHGHAPPNDDRHAAGDDNTGVPDCGDLGTCDPVEEYSARIIEDIAGADGNYAASGPRTRAWLKELTKAPHVAGSPRDEVTATYVKEQFESFGIPRVEIKTYKVLLNYPLNGSVSIVSPESRKFTANLREPVVASDPISSDPDVTRGFHGYSASGSARAPVVYVNYCTVEDFATVRALGVSVEGSIVLCRYGSIFRGNKVENAQERGALGVLIYSDPADDGAAKGKVYPEGPWRSGGSVQRGSVYPGEGDPLTPGYAAVEEAERLTMEQSRDPDYAGNLGFHLGTIPSIPLSADAAAPIMAGLTGTAAPASFIGKLTAKGGGAVKYAIGGATAPTPLVVDMVNDMDFRPMTPIWNVIGVIPGSVEPDRAVILGNHRDAWVGGAVDPSSGTASMLETARALGAMYQDGWRPRRTIVIASVDAEEYGLVGSVEWGEELAATFGARAVAYLNCDESVTSQGPLRVRASPSLIDAIFATAKIVPQPTYPARQQRGTMFDAWLDLYRRTSGDSSAAEPIVEGLGSGSDFAVFLSHLGVTSCDMAIDGDPDQYGQYHSVYDSFPWMDKFGDPNWTMHPAVAAYWGALAVRLAESPVLPLEYTRLARYAEGYVDAAEKAAKDAGITGLNFARLRGKVAELHSSASAVAEARRASLTLASPLAHRIVSDRLMFAERALIAREGMPGRAWFKHVIYSPAKHNSYGSQKFPGLTDAIAMRDAQGAKEQLDVVARHIDAMAKQLVTESI